MCPERQGLTFDLVVKALPIRHRSDAGTLSLLTQPKLEDTAAGLQVRPACISLHGLTRAAGRHPLLM